MIIFGGFNDTSNHFNLSLNSIVVCENEFNSPRSYHDAFFNDSDGPSMYHYFKEVSYELLNVNTHHYPQCDLSTNLSYQDQYDRNYYK